MITKAFSVYDSKALCFGVPFFMPTVGSAVRAFSDLSNDAQSMVNRHPSDFVLYEIGSFSDSTGELHLLTPHVHLGLGSDFAIKPLAPIYRPAALDPVIKAVENPLATASELSNGA